MSIFIYICFWDGVKTVVLQQLELSKRGREISPNQSKRITANGSTKWACQEDDSVTTQQLWEAIQNAITPLDVNKHIAHPNGCSFLIPLSSSHILYYLDLAFVSRRVEALKSSERGGSMHRRDAHTRRPAYYKRPINWHRWAQFILNLSSSPWTRHIDIL